MHVKSVFNELELVIEIDTTLNPPIDKNQIITKKYDMPRMQRFELSLNDMVKLLTSRAPLDSTVIYPITQSPNKHHETGKRENISRSYLCLAHST